MSNVYNLRYKIFRENKIIELFCKHLIEEILFLRNSKKNRFKQNNCKVA